MQKFEVPGRGDVSASNQTLFDGLQKAVGFVPNLYATMAYSENGLATLLQLQNAKTSLSKKEKELVNLVVSQVNGCRYCQSAHTTIGKMNGFSDEQLIDVRLNKPSLDNKLNALVKFTREATQNRGKVSATTIDTLFAAGYSKENLVDILVAIGDKTIMNLLHNITQIAIDFPVAPELHEAVPA